MSVNMYCGAQYEYKQGVVHKLLKDGIIDFCVTDYIPDLGVADPDYDERIVTINHDPCITNRYEEICDINELPAVSTELLEALLPYESMAIKIGMRFLNYPVADYEEEKRNYYRHVRFWNYIYEKYNINFVFFNDNPHAQGKYVAYALAKVKNIPMLIIAPCSIQGRYVYGNDCFNLGKDIDTFYDELVDKNVAFELEGVVKDFYDNRIREINKIVDSSSNKSTKGEMLKWKRLDGDLNWFGVRVNFGKEYIWSIYSSFMHTRTLSEHKKKKDYFRYLKRQYAATKYYIKNNECKSTQYNKMASEPQDNENYILYALQYTPEASIIPTAGVYSEQYNAIQLLSRIAQKVGVMVYVKEHYVQRQRPIQFYTDIKSLKNVRLIKTNIPSASLIKNALAVATQTGTCVLEAAVIGKASLVMGRGNAWKKLPGVFEIVSEEQGAMILNSIIKGINIDSDLVKKYFYAIQKKTIISLTAEEQDEYLMNMGVGVDKSDCLIEDRVRIISEYIDASCRI